MGLDLKPGPSTIWDAGRRIWVLDLAAQPWPPGPAKVVELEAWKLKRRRRRKPGNPPD
jgi:hypothetical protein